MTTPDTTTVVMYLDRYSKPRAWAVGATSDRAQLERAAGDHLTAYLAEHGGNRDEYTLEVQQLPAT